MFVTELLALVEQSINISYYFCKVFMLNNEMISVSFPTFLSFIPEYVEEVIPITVSRVSFMLFQSFHFDIQNILLLVHPPTSRSWYEASYVLGTKHILIVFILLSHLALLSLLLLHVCCHSLVFLFVTFLKFGVSSEFVNSPCL